MLKLKYFGHLMWRANSLEKTDAGKNWGQEEKRMAEDEMVGWHQWLTGHKLSKLQKIMKNREAWHAAIHGISRSKTQPSKWTTATNFFSIFFLFLFYLFIVGFFFFFKFPLPSLCCKNSYIYWFLPSLCRVISQSYLRGCVWSLSPQLCLQVKHNSHLLKCIFFSWQSYLLHVNKRI